MTTDAFTAAAFESAASRYQGDWDAFEQEPVDDYGLSESERRAHIAGWEAARAHLAAQEPTDAEVEAAARALDPDAWGRDSDGESQREHARDGARAALTAAKEARR